MIVKMDKITIIMHDSDRIQNIEELKNLGLLHVQTREVPDESSDSLKINKKLIKKALSFFPEDKHEKQPLHSSRIRSSFSVNTALEYSKRIIRRYEILNNMEESLKELEKKIDNISLWGNFDPEDLELLKSKAVDIIPGTVPRKNNRIFQKKYKTIFLGKHKKNFLYALINEGEVPENLFIPFILPEKSLPEYILDKKNLLSEIYKISTEVKSLASHKSFLFDSLIYIDECLEYNSVYNSLETNDVLTVIEGFAPTVERNAIRDFSDNSGWAAIFSKPAEDDNVPTLVRNKKGVNIIKPIFDIMGVVPGYREKDISFVFLLFFSLFFSMIIGDAGYGLIMLASTVVAVVIRFIKKEKITDALFLMLLMSITTTVWGSITGTWFGSEKIAGLPFLKDLILRIFYVHDGNNDFNIILFSFTIGAVHLAIAHIWNIAKGIRNRSGLKTIAQFGWFAILLCGFYLVLNLVLSSEKFPLPNYIFPVIGGGLAVVIIFGNQEGNFFKGILKGFSGLVTTVLSAISSFSDIISYIRLYALGLASVEIAKSFNIMAESAGNSIYGVIGGALILVIGHGLNIAMAGLSVFVHGLRLNMLEFSNHLGMEWSGIKYNPFRERR